MTRRRKKIPLKNQMIQPRKEIYSGLLKNNIEVMLRVLDQETLIVDIRDHETEDYIDGFGFDNYESALAEYKNQYNIYR